jgi:hypothetical protein
VFGSVLRLACSADLFRAVLVAPRLVMRKNLVATGDGPADQLPQQRRPGRRDCVCVCVCLWGWARAGELRGISVREPLRASVSSLNGASGGIVIM